MPEKKLFIVLLGNSVYTCNKSESKKKLTRKNKK